MRGVARKALAACAEQSVQTVVLAELASGLASSYRATERWQRAQVNMRGRIEQSF
jgi:hypothetical protein